MFLGVAALFIVGMPVAALAAEGMPQLDFGNALTISQIVWLAIIFAALYLLSARWALPKMGAVIEKRATVIAGDLPAAHRAKTEADAAVSELSAASREAHQTAQARIAAAIASAKDEAARRSVEEDRKLDTHVAEAEQRIGAARQAAFGALRQVASETASVVLTRLTGHAPDAAKVEAQVGAILDARAGGSD